MPERRECPKIAREEQILSIYKYWLEGYTLTYFNYQWFLRKRQNSVGKINSLLWPREETCAPGSCRKSSKALLPSARRERLNQTTLETDHYAVRVPLPDFDPPILASNPGGVSNFCAGLQSGLTNKS